MNTNISPTPWHNPRGSTAVYAKDGTKIASCGNAEIVSGIRSRGRNPLPEVTANACLIAKTPDMLHWLKETEHYLSSRLMMGYDITDGELWLLQHISQTIKEVT